MYIQGMNEEFAPPDEDYSEPAEPRSYRDTTPEPETRVLSPEEEDRVKRQHERYMKSAPVPGYGAADSSALEAAGFKVRTVD
jgi:hypothetical protein